MDPFTWVILGLGLIASFSAFGQQAWSQDASSSLQEDSQKFNAQQAEIDRDWQEEMYLKYNSLSGKIAQAKEAGVNPMLAVTGNATSPMSVQSTPASSGIGSAGSAPSSVAAITQLMDTLSNVKLKKAQVDNLNQDTSNKADLISHTVAETKARTASYMANADLTREQIKTAYDEALSRIRNMDADTEVKFAQFDSLVDGLKTAALNRDVMLKGIELTDAQIDNYEAATKKAYNEIKALKQDFVFNKTTMSYRVKQEQYAALNSELESIMQAYENELKAIAVPSAQQDGFSAVVTGLLARFKLLRESVLDISF